MGSVQGQLSAAVCWALCKARELAGEWPECKAWHRVYGSRTYATAAAMLPAFPLGSVHAEALPSSRGSFSLCCFWGMRHECVSQCMGGNCGAIFTHWAI